MLPEKLKGGNFLALITSWKAMWNDKLQDHLRSMEIVPGPGIRVQRLSNGTVISCTRIPGGGVNAAPSDSEYNGYFKVVDVPDEDGSAPTQIRIIDGAAPSADNCGRTDLPGCVLVPCATLPKKAGDVYLQATWSGTAYQLKLDYGQATAPSGNILLATITEKGVINQIWVSGLIEFKIRYLI